MPSASTTNFANTLHSVASRYHPKIPSVMMVGHLTMCNSTHSCARFWRHRSSIIAPRYCLSGGISKSESSSAAVICRYLLQTPRKLFPDAIRGSDEDGGGQNPAYGMLMLLEAEFGGGEDDKLESSGDDV
jgi:hypothetical protein